MTSIHNAASYADATDANKNCNNNTRDIKESAEPDQMRQGRPTYHAVIPNNDVNNDNNKSTACQPLPSPTHPPQTPPELQSQLQSQLECHCHSLPPPPPRTFEQLEIATTYVETWALASGYRIVPLRGKDHGYGKHAIHMMCDGVKKSSNDLENNAPMPLDKNSSSSSSSIRKDRKLHHPNGKARKIACPFRLTLLLKMGIWYLDVTNPSHNHGRLPEPASSRWPGRKRGRPAGSRTGYSGREKFVQLEGGGAMISFRFDSDREAKKHGKPQNP